MASIRRHKILLDSTAEATGDWIPLDVRYDESISRAIQVVLVSGDTVIIEGITKDVKGTDKSFLDELTAEDIIALKTYAVTTADVLEGTWTYIRARKTGTTGNAKVQGFV